MAGQANVYDMTRADEPVEAGTPLNKASLLTDAVAASFGLGTSAVPNDALDILKKAVLAQVAGKYTQTTIGALPVGTIMHFNYDGSPVNFIIPQQGKPSSAYDDSCDGTWFLMQDALGRIIAGGGNEYAKSNVTKQLNGASFFDKLDPSLQANIKAVKIPYFDGEGTSGSVKDGANGFLTKVFELSMAETYGVPSSSVPAVGAKLAYFAAGNTISAKYNGTYIDCWTRDPLIGSSSEFWCITSSGSYQYYSAENNLGVRPAFILPSTLPVYIDDAGNIYTEQEYTAILTDVLGNEISLPQHVESGSYVGTGTYGASNPNTLTFGFAPKALLIQRVSMSGTGTVPFLAIWVSGATELLARNTANFFAAPALSAGLSVSWYIASNANAQMDAAGQSYVYVAVG